MENPFFLKKLITGPPIVPDNQDKIFVKKLLFPSLFLIISSVFFEIKFFLYNYFHEQTLGQYSLKLLLHP